MVKPASLPRISGPITCLALLLSSLPTIAQEAKKPTAEKEKSEEAVFIPVEYRPPPYQISVGVRISGKAKVKFSGLGAIPFAPSAFVGADTTTVGARIYNDGYVYPDTYVDINGASVARPASMPADNKTNYWSFNSSSQLVEHPTVGQAVAYHGYAIESAGATREAASGSSTSWDVEISRQLGGNRKITWGILFGASLSSINAKTSGEIPAYLHTVTDYYSLAGITGTAAGASGAFERYQSTPKLNADGKPVLDSNGAPTYEPVYDPVTNAKLTYWSTPQRISDHPDNRTDVIDTANPVAVDGYWQVKGAFITARFGPFVTLNLGRHFAVRASAGVTFTVLGANFILRERYLVPSLGKYLDLDRRFVDSTVSGTLGYYAEGEIQAFLTQRTGLFFGAAYESYSRDLRLQIYNQVADLSASSGTAIRTGITTRF